MWTRMKQAIVVTVSVAAIFGVIGVSVGALSWLIMTFGLFNVEIGR